MTHNFFSGFELLLLSGAVIYSDSHQTKLFGSVLTPLVKCDHDSWSKSRIINTHVFSITRTERRGSQDCRGYQPPGGATVFGDPHIYTFDHLESAKKSIDLINHQLHSGEKLPNLHIKSSTGWLWSGSSGCPAAKLFLPNYHLPKQNRAYSGTGKIKVNQTQVSDHIGHPVFFMIRCENWLLSLTFTPSPTRLTARASTCSCTPTRTRWSWTCRGASSRYNL